MKSRREFLKIIGASPACLYLSSLASSSLIAGCTSSASPMPASPVNWSSVREHEFQLNSSSVYLNNSTLGPTLKRVVQKMSGVQELFSSGISVWDFVQNIVFAIAPIRDTFTGLVNAHVDERGSSSYVGIVDSVTDGMSLVANGLNFSPGDGILMTDHEHTGGKTMWELQRDRHQAVIYEVPLTVDGETEDAWEQGLLDRFETRLKTSFVKVVSFSYLTTSTGHILPVKKLCRLARDYGAISVVDAAQAFAAVPLDVMDLDCDFLVVNGHKYLCGPIGTGFICIHPRMLQTAGNFWPTIVDDNYYNPTNPARSNRVRKGGVKAFTNILALSEALEFYKSIGTGNVYDRLAGIGRWLRTGLSRFPESFELITPATDGLSGGMTCFRIKGMESESVADLLESNYSIIVKHATEGGADAVRLAPHYFNTEEELNRLARALCEIAGVDAAVWLAENNL